MEDDEDIPEVRGGRKTAQHAPSTYLTPSVNLYSVECLQEFVDPISFACMHDPVLLCGTGQVYCLNTLRSWLAMGSRTCPKTNMVMRDVEVGVGFRLAVLPGWLGKDAQLANLIATS